MVVVKGEQRMRRGGCMGDRLVLVTRTYIGINDGGDSDGREAVSVAIGGACCDGEEAAIEALGTTKK